MPTRLRGREALAALDFYVHADLFMNPTAELADIVLPVATPFEREALKLGFEISAEAQSLVQLRRPVVAAAGRGPLRHARSSSTWRAASASASTSGTGDIEAAYRYQLGPSGLSLETLREHPGGVRAAARRRATASSPRRRTASPRGFNTPTRKVELYSETMLRPRLPAAARVRGAAGRARSPGRTWLERYPLILTCAKHTLFCETQHRGAAEPAPAGAGPRGRAAPGRRGRPGHPAGRLGADRDAGRQRPGARPAQRHAPAGRRLRAARLVAGLPRDRRARLRPVRPDGANFNLLIGNEAIDPVSGSVPHRAYLCQVHLAG